MSWDEQFASHYDEWSAAMTEDVPFYVRLAADIDGPLVELAVGTGRVGLLPLPGAPSSPDVG